ncbi:hypothetical protein Tco_0858878 [Tanacetum coccineum]|uniref:Uncharacterized protein n=1 Tax=Tanacetum coccineum TaxID=301880 RepID=A0ABQ5BE56_9ASTR
MLMEKHLLALTKRRLNASSLLLGRVRRRMSWREFILSLGLHTSEEMQTIGFDLYWAESARQIPDKRDLSTYWIGISSMGNFLGTPPSYTLIKDPMLRLYHKLIVCSIAGRSQAPKKVVHFREESGCDDIRWSVCCPSGGAFWVTYGGEALGIDGDSNEGAPAIPAPVQAPQQPPLAARPAQTMAQMLARVEEDVHEMRGALGEQRQILDSMARDFSRFSTWTVVGLLQMMSQAGVRIKPDRPRYKEIDDVGEISTIWKSRSVGVLKSQDGCSTCILAHKLNLENLPSKISWEFLILILFNLLIMEYLVKIIEKVRILKLKRRHLKITVLTSYTPYPSRKYLCLHFTKDHKGTRINTPYPEEFIHRIQDIVIKYSGRYQTWSLLQETPDKPY